MALLCKLICEHSDLYVRAASTIFPALVYDWKQLFPQLTEIMQITKTVSSTLIKMSFLRAKHKVISEQLKSI